jgi:hypothetical protein
MWPKPLFIYPIALIVLLLQPPARRSSRRSSRADFEDEVASVQPDPVSVDIFIRGQYD